jgi:hypothetical protein
MVAAGEMASGSLSLAIVLCGGVFATVQYEGGGGGGVWEQLGDEVEKRVPTVDKSTEAKGEKIVMHPTSVNPAFLEMFECHFKKYIADESIHLGDSSFHAHHMGFLARLEGSCHQLEGNVNATNFLPTC